MSAAPNTYIVVSHSTTRLGLVSVDRTVVRIPLTPDEDTSNCNPVLHKAAAMLIFSLVVAGALLLDSIWLQIVMQAIHFDAITISPSRPRLAFGRGLFKMCLDFGTISNEGFPFTYDLTAPDTDLQPIAVAQNETLELQNGVSRITDSRRCDAKSDPWPPRCAHTSGGHPLIQC
jgi:hypothetical protein